MRKIKIGILLTILLISIYIVNAEESVTDDLTQGEIKTYTINSFEYTVEVGYIGGDPPDVVKFRINDELTPIMSVNDIHQIDEYATIEIIDFYIVGLVGAMEDDFVTFKLVLESYCGDYVCDSNENCEEDDCCDGEKVDLEDDEDNCGECNNKCDDDNEKCLNGDCETYCGNDVCESNEDCESCSKDCGECEIEEEEEETIIEEKESEKAEDECDGCLSQGKCFPKGISGFQNETQPVYCGGNDWILKKELNENCEYDYECKINSCKEGICKEIKSKPLIVKDNGIFQRIWKWINGIF